MVSFADYKANPTIANRNALVVANLGLARFAASGVAERTPVLYEDLEQVAMLGLIIAVERFDPDLNVKFSRFALPVINGRLLNFVRDKAHLIKIPRNYFAIWQKSKRVTKEFIRERGRQPSYAEVADILGISSAQYKIIANSYLNCRYVSEIKIEPTAESILANRIDKEIAIPESIVSIFDTDMDCASYEQLAVYLYFVERIKISKIAKILEVRTKDILYTIRDFLLTIEL